jgi:hypothetical protein
MPVRGLHRSFLTTWLSSKVTYTSHANDVERKLGLKCFIGSAELKILTKHRFLKHGSLHIKHLSYVRAMSGIVAYPRDIVDENEIRSIPGVGEKLKVVIAEFLENGSIAEATRLRNSSKFNAMCELNAVHGIGESLFTSYRLDRVTES